MEFLDNIGSFLETLLGHESVFEFLAAGIFCFFIGTWRIIRHPRQAWRNGLWNTYKQAWRESREKQELKKAKLQAKADELREKGVSNTSIKLRTSSRAVGRAFWNKLKLVFFVLCLFFIGSCIMWWFDGSYDQWKFEQERSQRLEKVRLEAEARQEAREAECAHFNWPRVLFVNGERIRCD